MKFGLRHIFLAILIITFLVRCSNTEEYPIIPEIEFDSFVKIYNPTQGIYDRGVLKITFKDGDGDIGLSQSDTVAPYDYNLIISYFEIQNGDTVEVFLTEYNQTTGEFDTLTFNARVPILTPSGNNKSIKGEIEDTLFIYNYASPYDTIMFKTYLMDRALHKSNEVVTPLISRK